jgi:hypothetical protein
MYINIYIVIYIERERGSDYSQTKGHECVSVSVCVSASLRGYHWVSSQLLLGGFATLFFLQPSALQG